MNGVDDVRRLPDHQPAGVIPEVIPVEEARRIHLALGRRAQPLLPVEIALESLLPQAGLVVQPPTVDQPHLAESTPESMICLAS